MRDSQHVEATSLTYSATPPSTPKSRLTRLYATDRRRQRVVGVAGDRVPSLTQAVDSWVARQQRRYSPGCRCVPANASPRSFNLAGDTAQAPAVAPSPLGQQPP